MGARVGPRGKWVLISLKIQPYLLAKIEELARMEGISRSELIRRALELYVSIKEADKKKPVEKVTV